MAPVDGLLSSAFSPPSLVSILSDPVHFDSITLPTLNQTAPLSRGRWFYCCSFELVSYYGWRVDARPKPELFTPIARKNVKPVVGMPVNEYTQ